jgi:hypothetical protein
VSEPTLSSIELTHSMDHPPFSGEQWIFEFKYDGYRVLANKEQLLTRQKKDATTWYPEIVKLSRSCGARSLSMARSVCSMSAASLSSKRCAAEQDARSSGPARSQEWAHHDALLGG